MSTMIAILVEIIDSDDLSFFKKMDEEGFDIRATRVPIAEITSLPAILGIAEGDTITVFSKKRKA